MAVDPRLTTDRDIQIDTTGDIDIAYDNENIRQQHVNAIFRAVENSDINFTSIDNEVELKSDIESELNRLRYVVDHKVEVNAISHEKFEAIIKTNATQTPITREVNV